MFSILCQRVQNHLALVLLGFLVLRPLMLVAVMLLSLLVIISLPSALIRFSFFFFFFTISIHPHLLGHETRSSSIYH